MRGSLGSTPRPPETGGAGLGSSDLSGGARPRAARPSAPAPRQWPTAIAEIGFTEPFGRLKAAGARQRAPRSASNPNSRRHGVKHPSCCTPAVGFLPGSICAVAGVKTTGPSGDALDTYFAMLRSEMFLGLFSDLVVMSSFLKRVVIYNGMGL